MQWDVETEECMSGPFLGHTSAVNSVTFSTDGKCIASGSDDNHVRIWGHVSVLETSPSKYGESGDAFPHDAFTRQGQIGGPQPKKSGNIDTLTSLQSWIARSLKTDGYLVLVMS